MSRKIGVLSLQGDFAEHLHTLSHLDCDASPVKTPDTIRACDGLIIPGGESTTIGKLIQAFDIEPALRELHESGRPIFGTCAGVILIAKDIVGSDQWRLGILDCTVERNAYGRQVDSFETELKVEGIDDLVHGVFIRAPVIAEARGDCRVLGTFNDRPVIVREGNLLGACFHPELTDELRIHQYFLEMCS
ncbi:MAG TPA: pyridoxal 5'-phosphate synthase glutaminase subunit PdxT [Armatimonadota bacterium]|nr:pyridoxal 5'-phosphate synthase glutaminase subunit PdxT [Armatimonadota bacterium]